MTKEYRSTRGARQRMSTSPVAGGFALGQTQLIRAQTLPMGQYLVTMMPPTKGDGSLPYTTTYDNGLVYPAVLPAINTAPILPDQPAALQVLVTWGAGGVRYRTLFDYPALGGTFSITCDAMDVDVLVKGNQVIAYNDTNQIPVVGAFYILGSPVDDTPMAWLEATNVALAGLTSRFYAVKPFSKDVTIYLGTTGAAVERWAVEFLNTAGTTLAIADFLVQGPGSDVRTLQVPRQATVMSVTNRTAVGKSLSVEWGIGLS